MKRASILATIAFAIAGSVSASPPETPCPDICFFRPHTGEYDCYPTDFCNHGTECEDPAGSPQCDPNPPPSGCSSMLPSCSGGYERVNLSCGQSAQVYIYSGTGIGCALVPVTCSC